MTPEERPLTINELNALNVGAVVIDRRGYAWQKDRERRWVNLNGSVYTAALLVEDYHLTLIHPAPEPDHSMCARLVEDGTFGVGAVNGQRRWALRFPNAALIHNMTDAEARAREFAIPEPEPTVVERAAREIDRVGLDGGAPATAFAQALADAGLLAQDGER